MTYMVTAHRAIHNPSAVAGAVRDVILYADLVIVGGAEGGDTIAAQVCARAKTPFRVYLPNRWYTTYYKRATPQSLIDQAEWAMDVVDRPDVPDWRQRWDDERWWLDNFRRNDAMGIAATRAIVISPLHPVELAKQRKGGTAHCVRALLAQSYREVTWVPDTAKPEVQIVPLAQPALFD